MKRSHQPQEGPRHGRQRHWKARALEKQIERCLSMTLMGDVDDELLQQLYVYGVEQAADPGSMQVTLVAPDDVDPIDALERVNAAAGHLRNEVTRAISRKKTPLLSYRVVPESALGEG